ncbi:MAG: metallophosphoesterase, partial [Myxococcota bacterium]|nr:metallophosphoesterase [Myxococcota bacterium]
MAIWAISDLHLSLNSDKPMDVFGKHWADHHLRMAESWDALVSPDDLVLVPGDNSWALKLDEAAKDLQWIGDRPGTKMMLKGNHDYWWTSIGKVRKAMPEGVFGLQNDTLEWGNYRIAGARLWNQPGHKRFTADDEKIYLREIERLKLSLALAAKQGAKDGKELIVMVHYPPFREHNPSVYTELIESSGTRTCIYGHLHGYGSHQRAFQGEHEGVNYQ